MLSLSPSKEILEDIIKPGFTEAQYINVRKKILIFYIDTRLSFPKLYKD